MSSDSWFIREIQDQFQSSYGRNRGEIIRVEDYRPKKAFKSVTKMTPEERQKSLESALAYHQKIVEQQRADDEKQDWLDYEEDKRLGLFPGETKSNRIENWLNTLESGKQK